MTNIIKTIGKPICLLAILVMLAGFVTHAIGAEPDELTFLQGEKTRLLIELRAARIEQNHWQAEADRLRKEIESLDAEIEKEVEPTKTGKLNFSVGDR